jgi:hypothetical protein
VRPRSCSTRAASCVRLRRNVTNGPANRFAPTPFHSGDLRYGCGKRSLWGARCSASALVPRTSASGGVLFSFRWSDNAVWWVESSLRSPPPPVPLTRRRGSTHHRALSDLTSAFAPVACAPFRLRCADRWASSHAGLWFRRRWLRLVLVERCAPPLWFGSRFHALLAGVGWWLVAPPHCPHPPGCSAMRFASLPHRRTAPR